MKNKWIALLPFFLLVLIYCLGVFPGIIKRYTAFTYDNGRDMLVTFKILYEGKLTLIGPTTGINGIFHGPWWYYFLVIPFIVFRGDPTGVAITIAFCGLLGLIALFALLLKVFNSRVAFFGGLVYATSPEIVGRFSQIGNNNLEAIFGVLSLLFLYLYLYKKEKNNIYLGLFALMNGFLFEFEFAYGLFIIAFSVIFFLIFIKANIKRLIWFFGFLAIPLSPRIFFEVKHHFLMTNTFINYLLHPSTQMYNGALPDRFLNRLSIFSQFWKDLFRPEFAFLAAMMIMLVIISLPYAVKTKDKKQKLIFILSSGATIFVFACFLYYKDVLWGYYINGIMAYYIFIACFAIYFLERAIKFGKYITSLIIFLIISAFTINFMNNLYAKEWIGDYSVMRNQLNIINSIQKDSADEKTYSLGVYSGTGFSYPYDYWFLWFEKFHGIARPKSLWQSRVNYLIIEPDDRKILVDKWMERNINKNAKLINRKKIVDVIVEKWQLD